MEPAQVPDRLLLKILVTAAVVLAALWVVVRGDRHPPAYYKVDKLIASGLHTHDGEYLRVHGSVVAGTLRTLGSSKHYFLLSAEGATVPVILNAELPATVRDRSQAVVGGTVSQRSGAWVIEGDELFTKCVSNYKGYEPDPGKHILFK